MGGVSQSPQMSRVGEVVDELLYAPCPDPRKVQLMPGSNGGMSAAAPSKAGAAPVESASFSASAGYTTSYARVEVMVPGGYGFTRVEQLATQPEFEHLTLHVRGLLGVPGRGSLRAVNVNTLLDSGSRIMSILEALAAKLQQNIYDGPII